MLALLFGLAMCAATPIDDHLPAAAVIGPITGRHPVWLVDGSFGHPWEGENRRIKSAWVLPREVTGDLRVEGRRLDAPGTLL